MPASAITSVAPSQSSAAGARKRRVHVHCAVARRRERGNSDATRHVSDALFFAISHRGR